MTGFPFSPPDPPPPRRSGPRPWWALVGSVLGVLFALVGLAALGVFVLLLVGINSYGSNK